MARHKPPLPSKRVWRISDRAPLGEWVDPSLPVDPLAKEPPAGEVSSGRWVRSSFDLLNGIDVNDDPNTVPDDLFDEYFKPAVEEPKKPAK